jgi:site-specific DNA recombinase
VLTRRAVGGAGPGFGDLIYTEATGKTKEWYGYFLCRARQEGLCDLPHIRVELVEESVVGHYDTLRLPDSFR